MPSKDNQQYIADMDFGFGEEDRINPILEEKFGELTKMSKYSPFDFENDDYIIEVKSRRIPHNKYKTLMFNYSKIEKLEGYDTTKIAIFVFNCSDGIYYWEYDESEFTIGRGGRCDRGCNEYYTMAYVEVSRLHPLTEPLTFNKEEEEEKESCCDTIKKKVNSHLQKEQ